MSSIILHTFFNVASQTAVTAIAKYVDILRDQADLSTTEISQLEGNFISLSNITNNRFAAYNALAKNQYRTMKELFKNITIIAGENNLRSVLSLATLRYLSDVSHSLFELEREYSVQKPYYTVNYHQ